MNTREILIVLMLICLCGCASIIKGRKSRVELIGPVDDLVITRADTIPVPIYRDWDSTLYLSLPAREFQTILLRYRSNSDTLLLEQSINGGWVAANIATSWGLGALIDAGSGASYDFSGRVIAFGVSDKDTTAPPRWWFAKRSAVSGLKPETPETGIMAMIFIGVTSPVVQVPVAFVHYGFGLGYKITPRLAFLGLVETQSCTDLRDYRGDLRASTYDCDLRVSTYSFETRFYLFRGLYASGAVGGSSMQIDSLVPFDSLMTDRGKVAGFSARIPVAGFGLGYAWSVGFLEYRLLYGTERISLRDQTSARLRFNTLRIGVNLVF